VMLDCDTSFEADFAARLVSTMYRYDLDVVTGVYSFKQPPYSPVLYMRNTETDQHEPVKDWDSSAELFQVDAAGGGCLCVRRRVFDRIRRELNEQPFERMGSKGEDFSFFRRLKALGIKTYCAWKIEMVHLDYQHIRTSNFYSPEGVPTGHEYQVVGFEPARAGVV
jgi:GT2 family glycosyltransferase